MSQKYEKRPQVRERHQAAPKITIYQMLVLAEEIYKQTGQYITYGKLESEINEGRINPSDYLGGVDYGRSEMDKDMHGHIR